MIVYATPNIPSIDSIETFCEAVKTALKYWYDIHTDPEAWAYSWVGGHDVYDLYADNGKNNVGGHIFTFEWEDYAVLMFAEKYKHDWARCSSCESIYEVGGCCDCEDDNADALDVNPRDLASELMELEFVVPDIGIVEDALVKFGFDEYRAAVHDITCGVESEIEECLEAIEGAGDNQDLISAILWATRVWHTHGNIMDDYSGDIGVDSHLISDIRDDGLESHFDRDEIREFLEG